MIKKGLWGSRGRQFEFRASLRRCLVKKSSGSPESFSRIQADRYKTIMAYLLFILALILHFGYISMASCNPTVMKAIAVPRGGRLNSTENGMMESGIDIDVFRLDGRLVVRKGSDDQCIRFSVNNTQQLTVDVIARDDLTRQIAQSKKGGKVFTIERNEKIFGIYKLPGGYCVAFIKSSEPATNFIGDSFGVRRVKEVSFVLIPSGVGEPVPGTELWTRHRNAIALMDSTFTRHDLYFSTGHFDVTRNLQSNYQEFGAASKEEMITPSWRHCDERFFWNLNVISDLIDVPGLHDQWITPVTNAWVATEEISAGKNNEKFMLSLISRRSRRRQGPRYYHRPCIHLIVCPITSEISQLLLV